MKNTDHGISVLGFVWVGKKDKVLARVMVYDSVSGSIKSSSSGLRKISSVIIM